MLKYFGCHYPEKHTLLHIYQKFTSLFTHWPRPHTWLFDILSWSFYCKGPIKTTLQYKDPLDDSTRLGFEKNINCICNCLQKSFWREYKPQIFLLITNLSTNIPSQDFSLTYCMILRICILLRFLYHSLYFYLRHFIYSLSPRGR